MKLGNPLSTAGKAFLEGPNNPLKDSEKLLYCCFQLIESGFHVGLLCYCQGLDTISSIVTTNIIQNMVYVASIPDLHVATATCSWGFRDLL